MLKGHSKWFETLHKSADLIIILACWQISYFLRFRGISDTNTYIWYQKVSILLVFLFYFFSRRESLYSSKRFEPLNRELISVTKAFSFTFLWFIILTFAISHFRVSRIHLSTFYGITILGLFLFKTSLRIFLKRLRSKGFNTRHIIICGQGEQLIEYVKKTRLQHDLGIRIIGWVDGGDLPEKYNIRALTEFDIKYCLSLKPDMFVLGYCQKSQNLFEDRVTVISNTMKPTIVLPNLNHALIGYKISDFQGIPTIAVNDPSIEPSSLLVKRIFDIILSFSAIIILSPLLLTLALLVKLTSKGPIFYSQVRMGLDGVNFKMYKFRSMITGQANTQGWTVKDDPRVTPIGKFIRKTSLDELPQLWNIFIGDMSVVGPRPERPTYVEKFREEIPNYMLRHKMKAGLTGWAQVNGWRGDTSIEKRIQCDLYYIKNWSVWMDISIIIMTFYKGFINRNAY